MKRKTEDWQRAAINALTLRMILIATIGTLIAALIAFFLSQVNLGGVRPELLFIPWGIVLVVGISSAFRQGVQAERKRQHMLANPPTEPPAEAAEETEEKTE